MVTIYGDTKSALQGVFRDNITIIAGGSGLYGIPKNVIFSIRDSGVKNLTVISNNCEIDDFGLGILLQTRQIKKMISHYVGKNKTFEHQYLNNELELELNPQGTLADVILEQVLEPW